MNTSPEKTSVKSSTKANKKEKRRLEIVAAAIETFAKKGYHKTSISEIIEKANIARGTFYLYFDGKHSIFESILEDALNDLRSCIRPVDLSTGSRPPVVQLRENVTRILEFVTLHPPLVKLLFNPGLSPNDVINGKIESFFGMGQMLLESAIKHGVQLKLVAPCEVEIVASAAMGALRGVVQHYIARNKKVDLTEATETILRFALSGILRSTPKN